MTLIRYALAVIAIGANGAPASEKYRRTYHQQSAALASLLLTNILFSIWTSVGYDMWKDPFSVLQWQFVISIAIGVLTYFVLSCKWLGWDVEELERTGWDFPSIASARRVFWTAGLSPLCALVPPLIWMLRRSFG